MVEDPFQSRMARLADVPSIAVALVVFHPSHGSMEARFHGEAGAAKWRPLEGLAEKFRSLEESEEVDEGVIVDGVPHRLVATTVDPFHKDGTPFILALVAGETVGDDVLAALRSTIQDCMGAIYGR